MLNYLLEGVIAGVSLLLLFVIIERVRFVTGKEMLTDRLLVYLEGVHRRTAPKEDEEMEIQEYPLSDKVKVMELHFHKTESK